MITPAVKPTAAAPATDAPLGPGEEQRRKLSADCRSGRKSPEDWPAVRQSPAGRRRWSGFDLLLGCCLQIAGCQRLGAQSLIESKTAFSSAEYAWRAPSSNPVAGHHLDHLGKGRQSDVWRIEAAFSAASWSSLPSECIFPHPGGKRLDRINIRGSRQNLKDEGIRVQGNRPVS